MINIKLTSIIETGSQYNKKIPLAFAIGSLFMYVLYNILPFTFKNVSALLEVFNNLNGLLFNSNASTLLNTLFLSYNPFIADIIFTNFLDIQSVGHSLFTYQSILLIILSVILLLAMLAPIFISRK